ncbi:MAG TPA: hypothetical protein VKB93_28535 [Thermoanaerobaculia bacterium]|nr:hypothetical protein [Thermoanaerobaculia bacterium]
MRLLKRLFATLLASFVLTDSVVVMAASPACQKEVYIYFDVSGSMYEEQDGINAQELFTGTIAHLLRAESFVGPSDRIVIVIFAESAVTLFDGSDVRTAATAVESIRPAPPAEARAVGSTNSTNMVAVVHDILGRIDPRRKQIFIIASDFAHHPQSLSCSEVNRRILHFRNEAQSARQSLDDQPVKLALLTGEVVGESCGGANQAVSKAVKAAFHEILNASGEVEISPVRNVIANQLRRAIADPITLGREPLPDRNLVGIAVRNPNPFTVFIRRVILSSEDGKIAEEIPQDTTVACRSEETIRVEIPPSLQSASKLVASVDANTPPGPALELPSEFVLITQPEVHVFKNFGKDTYVVELAVEKTDDGRATLTVSGVPGAKPQTYEIDATKGPAHVALTLPGEDSDNVAVVKVTANGDLLVKTREGEIREEKETHGEPAQSGAEHLPGYVRLAALISAILGLFSFIARIPGGIHKSFKIFLIAHEAHIFHGALGAALNGLGITAATLFWWWPYGLVFTSARFENIFWATTAGGLTLFLYRSIAIVGWRLFERHLLTAPRALALRALITIAGVLFALAMARYAYLRLETTISAPTLVHPASHP